MFSKEDYKYTSNFNTAKYISDNFDAREKQIIEGLDLLIVKEGDKTIILKCNPILLREKDNIDQCDIKKVGRLTDLYEHDKYCMLLDDENMERHIIKSNRDQFIRDYRDMSSTVFCEEVLNIKLLPYQKTLLNSIGKWGNAMASLNNMIMKRGIIKK